MKSLQLVYVLFLLTCLSSCQAIGDIFKAGMGVGIFIVLAVIGLIVFVIAKVAGGGK